MLVVVSRWYGGIQLGPDRFKHINNCARNVLEKCNFITQSPHNKVGGYVILLLCIEFYNNSLKNQHDACDG